MRYTSHNLGNTTKRYLKNLGSFKKYRGNLDADLQFLTPLQDFIIYNFLKN